MTPRPHSDTESRLEGFEARLQDALGWANEHGREIVIAIAAFLVLGGAVAGYYEYRKRSLAEAQTELARIEARFAKAMGANAEELFLSEPANPDQARAAREAAVAELDAFAKERASTPSAPLAAIRAAELEVDLGNLDGAGTRLDATAAGLAEDDPRRAIALRLRAYVYDAEGDTLKAAETYEAAARIESYPPRGLAWIAAGDGYARANQPERAIAAYRQALATAPEVSEQEGIVARLGVQQAKLETVPAAPPSTPPAASPAPATTSDK